MPIDQYEHDFQYIVENELPLLMKELKKCIEYQRSMSEFATNGVGVATLCRNLGIEKDFPGCYVLMEETKPIYVGISKSVLRRLRQHVRGTTHFDASLAYRIAAEKVPHGHTRSIAMKQAEFKESFNDAKAYLRTLNVGYVKINNPLVLYLFEPYCAMHFDTSEWNTFETH